MEKSQKLQLINEIKQIERELYLKRSHLGAVEAMEYYIPSLRLTRELEESDIDSWKEVFSALIEEIGIHSTGGNSVEDIRKERRG